MERTSINRPALKAALVAVASAAMLASASAASAHGAKQGGTGYQNYGQAMPHGCPYGNMPMGRGMMGPQGQMGPGMMGPQGQMMMPYGRGMMMGPQGQMGPGMMGPQGQMPMMPYGQGMMMGPQGQMGQGMTGQGYGQQQALREPLAEDDVRAMFEQWVARHGNPRLKVGNVEANEEGAIVAEIVTQDGSLVNRFAVDPETGMTQPLP